MWFKSDHSHLFISGVGNSKSKLVKILAAFNHVLPPPSRHCITAGERGFTRKSGYAFP